MASNKLALKLLINAKDRASSVFAKLRSNAGKVAGAIVGYFGVRFFKNAIDDAEELQRQVGTLEGIIKSTGGAAGLTADEIVTMSKRLDEQTLGSAKSFRTAASSLLTFKSVSKDSFETTLKLAQDLAAAGFGTLEGNAIQLAKALEDPVLGLSALRRSGVSFTESQKELIKSLVKSGEKAKAQKIILEALTKQVGGAGSGAGGGLSGAVDLAGKRFTDFKERLGQGMLKPLTQANKLIADFLGRLNNSGGVESFGTRIANVFTRVIQFSQSVVNKIDEIYTRLTDSGVIATFSEQFGNAWGAIKNLVSTVGDLFTRLFSILADTTSTATFGDTLGAVLIKIIEGVTFLVNAFATGLSTIETAFHTLAGVGASFFSAIMQGIANLESGLAKITFGGVSERWAAEAEKSRIIAESFAASAEVNFNKADLALQETAKNAEATNRSVLVLAGGLITTAKTIDKVAESNSKAAKEADQLSKSIKKAGEQAEISGDKTRAAAAKSAQGIQEEAAAVKSVETAFKNLGITSSQALNEAAKNARTDYLTIRDSGVASAEDIAKAWNAYLKTAEAANKGVLDKSIEVEKQQYKVGVAADKTGDQMANAYGKAEKAIDGLINKQKQSENSGGGAGGSGDKNKDKNYQYSGGSQQSSSDGPGYNDPNDLSRQKRRDRLDDRAEKEWSKDGRRETGYSSQNFNALQHSQYAELSAKNQDEFANKLQAAMLETSSRAAGFQGRDATSKSIDFILQGLLKKQADQARYQEDRNRQVEERPVYKSGSKTVNVNLSLDGKEAKGSFPDNASTAAFLEQIKRAGLTSA